jgi:hypothetical protein
MEKLNNENLIKLLKILDGTDNNELLMKVEILRNLGQFDESRDLLKRMNKPKFDWIKDRMIAEINMQNKKVVQLY